MDRNLTLPGGHEIVELPMGFRGLMPTVEVHVNGQGPFTFAIDTGGQGEARLDTALVTRLGLTPDGTMQASDGSSANTRTLETLTIDTLSVGSLTFRQLTALTRNYNESPNLPPIDGILCFNLFSDYLLTLDYPGKQVRLAKGELPPANGQNVLDFAAPHGIAMLDLLVGNRKVPAHLDSGNLAGGVMLPEAVVQAANWATEPVVVGKARTVTSEIEIKRGILQESIWLGQYEQINPEVSFFPGLPVGNVGGQILSQFAITFDQQNQRLALARGDGD
ncbi:MAG: retropepsin-like domain-containing protein [Anaerolineales bacterium]|nr:retropepsin-like domain-containing protein [Anaerolineales bacterium]